MDLSLTSSTQIWISRLRAHLRISKPAVPHLHPIRAHTRQLSLLQAPGIWSCSRSSLAYITSEQGIFRHVQAPATPVTCPPDQSKPTGWRGWAQPMCTDMLLLQQLLHSKNASPLSRQVWTQAHGDLAIFRSQILSIFGKDELARQPFLRADDKISLHYHLPLSLAAQGQISSLYRLKPSTNGGLLC